MSITMRIKNKRSMENDKNVKNEGTKLNKLIG